MSKVYGYCRLAYADEEEMMKQVESVDRYCKQHGLVVDRHFCDNGVSGRVLNRDELNQMFDVLQRGDVIVTKNIARLTRSVYECITLTELIAKMGVTLLLINQ